MSPSCQASCSHPSLSNHHGLLRPSRIEFPTSVMEFQPRWWNISNPHGAEPFVVNGTATGLLPMSGSLDAEWEGFSFVRMYRSTPWRPWTCHLTNMWAIASFISPEQPANINLRNHQIVHLRINLHAYHQKSPANTTCDTCLSRAGRTLVLVPNMTCWMNLWWHGPIDRVFRGKLSVSFRCCLDNPKRLFYLWLRFACASSLNCWQVSRICFDCTKVKSTSDYLLSMTNIMYFRWVIAIVFIQLESCHFTFCYCISEPRLVSYPKKMVYKYIEGGELKSSYI